MKETTEKVKSRAGKHRRVRVIRWFAAVFLVCMVALISLVALVSLSPVTGTYGADFLRKVFGPKPVAELETVVFTIQDAYNQLVFQINPDLRTDPWSNNLPEADSSQELMDIGGAVTILVTSTPEVTPGVLSPSSTSNPSLTEVIAKESPDMEPGLTPQPTMTAQPLLTAVSDNPWMPEPAIPMSGDPNEGIWTPYIQDDNKTVLAYRTFLLPDADRPYVIAGIVAIDLEAVELHFQLGTHEPQAPGKEPGSGRIEAEDMQAGILLAAFNGGFKTINGNFGVMFEGKERIPPIDGIGTIAIYNDGHVQIGEWGTDLTHSPDLVTFRQNCPLMVRRGEINPQVYNNSVNDWGGTISGNIVTFRSGVGISKDGRTLYYIAGNNLSMPALAEAMLNAGIYQAMQLDINNYYVLFTRFEYRDQAWVAEPLLPRQMVDKLDRFLGTYSHDFFYLTVRSR